VVVVVVVVEEEEERAEDRRRGGIVGRMGRRGEGGRAVSKFKEVGKWPGRSGDTEKEGGKERRRGKERSRLAGGRKRSRTKG